MPAGHRARPRHATVFVAGMRPGDLVQAPQWALAFRTLQPEPPEPSRLLVLLHGVGGTEEQLAGLGQHIVDSTLDDGTPDDSTPDEGTPNKGTLAKGTPDEATLVVLPRGPRSVGNDMLGWFRVSLADGDARVVEEEEAEEARAKVAEFVSQCQERHGIDARRTVLAGFSQGGTLAASVALTAPEILRGFAVLCGRILPEVRPRVADRASLAHLSALLVHGRRDETLPVEWAERADEFLRQHGVAHALRLHDAGHELTATMQRDFREWYASLAG